MKYLYKLVFLSVMLIFVFLITLGNSSDVYGKKPEPTQDPYPALLLNDPTPVIEVQSNPYPNPDEITLLEYTHIELLLSNTYYDCIRFVWVNPVGDYENAPIRITMSINGGPYIIYGTEFAGQLNTGDYLFAYYRYYFPSQMETVSFIVSEAYALNPATGIRYYATNIPFVYSGIQVKWWFPLMQKLFPPVFP